MTRVALYARYSSDQQREASIGDQLRLCRLYAEKQGWTIADSYQDRAVSGASLIRPASRRYWATRCAVASTWYWRKRWTASAATRKMSPAPSSAWPSST